MKNRLIACAALFLSSSVVYCPEIRAQCSLNIQSGISSGWNKKHVSYVVEKNTLKIKVDEGGGADTDSIYIGSIKGCSTLTVNVSQISGRYPWGGKAIGFSFANDPIEPHQWGNQASFPPPRGRAIEDGFIEAGLSNNAKLVYDIDNSAKTTHVGAKVFIGSNNALELEFSAQEASREPQISAKQASPKPQFSARSHNPYTARAGYPSDRAGMSCSLSCHEPQAGHGEIVFTRGFSIPPGAVCPHERD